MNGCGCMPPSNQVPGQASSSCCPQSTDNAWSCSCLTSGRNWPQAPLGSCLTILEATTVRSSPGPQICIRSTCRLIAQNSIPPSKFSGICARSFPIRSSPRWKHCNRLLVTNSTSSGIIPRCSSTSLAILGGSTPFKRTYHLLHERVLHLNHGEKRIVLAELSLDTYNTRYQEEEMKSWQNKSRLSFYDKE